MKKSFLMLISVFVLSSCATILNEDYQQINVQTSNSKKTTISIDGNTHQVPGIVNVKRQKKDLLITTTAKGCTENMVVKHEVDSKFWINILSGGTFGSSTDYSTEKMWAYDDNVVINCN